MSWRVNATQAGNATLTFRYANGSTTARTARVRVNDGTVLETSVQLATTGAWTAWQEVSVNASLIAGPNVIELISDSVDGLANVDSLSVTGPGVSGQNCFTPRASTGETAIHDPSTILKENGVYWTFGTEFGIPSRFSYDLKHWHAGPTVFTPGEFPSWISPIVKNFEGMFWAPDIIEMNGRYYLYYSAYFERGANDGGDWSESAIGVAVTDSLNNPNWQDLGRVVDSLSHPRPSNGDFVNCIDAGLYRDKNNNVWMTYGSHFGGIWTVRINQSSGKITGNPIPIAGVGTGGHWTEYEAAQVQLINGYYYLFVNLGDCCAGSDSDYIVMVGRSANPEGPFVSEDGRQFYGPDLLSQSQVDNGVTTGSTLATDGIYIGPGHFGYLNNYGQNLASIHYYDGNNEGGWPARLELLELNFTSNGWPRFDRSNVQFVAEPYETTAYDVFVNGGSYQLIPASAPGQAIDLPACVSDDGTNVATWDNLGAICQEWHITSVGNDYYKLTPLVNKNSAMEITSASTSNGANINVWAYGGGAHQQFRLQKNSNRTFSLIARHSSQCLTLENNGTAAGTNIVQSSCTGAANQQFYIK